MRKNHNEEEQKALEQALKTDSEKKESANKKEKGPELNEPLYDVQVDMSGKADVVSEKAIEEVDYPPELAEFLGEVLENLHNQLGLAEDEPIPDDILDEFYRKLFSETDIETLVHELRAEKVFGVEPDESIPKYQLEDEESDISEDFSDEDLKNIDFSKLDMTPEGKRILDDIPLNCPEDYIGIIRQEFPVKLDEDFIKNKVIIRVSIPYLKEFPLKESMPDTNEAGVYLSDGLDVTYKIHPETYAELQELLMRIGAVESCAEIHEGEDIVGKVSQYFAASANEQREDGYYEDTMEYWYDGKIYHEKDVIWYELPRTVNLAGNMKGFSANLDSFVPLYEPCDITSARSIKVQNYRRVLSEKEKFEIEYYGKNLEFFEQLLPHEEVWYLATEFAKQQETSGYCVVCLNGKFYVPVETIVNTTTFECENLIVAFNVTNCYPIHHRCSGILIADVGNMQIRTAVRYAKGKVFDWHKRIEQELKAYYLHDSDFNPYDDPYDNPNNADGDWD